jgi:DNA polymerase-3 subunit gamma/tau
LDQAKTALKKLASQFQKEGKDSLASTIVSGELCIKENHILHFQVGSTIQKNALEKYRNEVVSFLRKNLQNWGIDISHEVIKSEKSNDIRLMTSIDKFKLMSEKNPDLLKLQKTFKLDIDF